MPALSIATSVPVPIAIPTVAAASAGASLMPSPPSPHSPFALQPLDDVAFFVRPDFGNDFVDAYRVGDSLRGRPHVPCQHHDAHALPVQALNRILRRGLDRVLDDHGPRGLTVDGNEHRRAAATPGRLCQPLER